MYELTAEEWYQIPGRGLIAHFGKDSLPDDVWEPGEFLEEVVSIDGKQYFVTGVEMFAINIFSKKENIIFGTEIKHGYNLNYGLLVKPLDSNASEE